MKLQKKIKGGGIPWKTTGFAGGGLLKRCNEILSAGTFAGRKDCFITEDGNEKIPRSVAVNERKGTMPCFLLFF